MYLVTMMQNVLSNEINTVTIHTVRKKTVNFTRFCQSFCDFEGENLCVWLP